MTGAASDPSPAQGQTATWSVRLARSQRVLDAMLSADAADTDPAALVVVTRSTDQAVRWRRRLSLPCQVLTLGELLGEAGAHQVMPEDLLPAPAVQWVVRDGLPAAYTGLHRDHMAREALAMIHLLEANDRRPPYPGRPANETEHALETAHAHLVAHLQDAHARQHFAAHERVSLAADGPSRFRRRFPTARRVALIGIDLLSPAERTALVHVVAGFDVAMYILGRPQDAAANALDDGPHPALTLSDPLVGWAATMAEPVDLDCGIGTGVETHAAALRDLCTLVPLDRHALEHVRIDAAQDPDAEVERTVTRIATLLDQDVPAHRVSIVTPDLSAYTGRLQDAFQQAGIPAAFSHQGHTSTTASGSLIERILDALDPRADTDAIIDLLSHPLARFPVQGPTDASGLAAPLDDAARAVLDEENTRRRVDGPRLRTALRRRGLFPRGHTGRWSWPAARQRLQRPADPVYGDDDRRAREHPRLPADIIGLGQWLHALSTVASSTDAVTFFERLRTLLAEASVANGVYAQAKQSDDPEPLLAAYRQVVRLLDDVEDAYVGTGRAGAPAREAMETLRNTLRCAELPLSADPDHGIQVLGWRNARGVDADFVFVLGMTAEAVPRRDATERHLRLLGRRHGRLEHLDPGQEARRILHTLLADAREVVLSHPEQDDGGDPQPRSILLDELVDSYDVAVAEAPPMRALHRADAYRLAARTGRALAEAAPWTDVQRALHHARVGPGAPTPHTGDLEDPAVRALPQAQPLLRDGTLSTSRLDTFTTCAFRSLYEKGLGLSGPTERVDDVPSLDRGDVVHHILDRYCSALLKTRFPLRLDAAELPHEQVRLKDLAQQVLDDVGFDTLPWQAARNDLLGGLDGDATRGHLVRFLDELTAFKPGEGIIASELSFGPGEEHEVKVPVGSLTLHLVGRIDRVDRVQTGGETLGHRVIDYKTGRAPAQKDVEEGKQNQPLVYLAALRVIEPDLPLVGAGYHLLKRPNRKESGLQKLPLDAATHDLERLVDETLPARLDEVLQAQCDGHFGLTLYDTNDAYCDYCDLRRVCGIRPALQSVRREVLAPRDDVGYVPERFRPAQDEDADDAAAGPAADNEDPPEVRL